MGPQLESVTKSLSERTRASFDRPIETSAVNRRIHSVTCLDLSCPFDCQPCEGFDPSRANRWLLWLGPGWESLLKSRHRAGGGKSPVAVPKKTISSSREKERLLITQKPHRKCPLSLTEEVHIPSYTDKRRSTKTFRRGQRGADYHNLWVCIPCKLSVCPFPSHFLLLHPLHCSLVSSRLRRGLKEQRWWEWALQPKPDSCVLPASL